MKIQDKVGVIVKFVNLTFKPDSYSVETIKDNFNESSDVVRIHFNFDEIDEKYIKNISRSDYEEYRYIGQDEAFERRIRKDVLSYLGIRTYGLQPPEFDFPIYFHPIMILVNR